MKQTWTLEGSIQKLKSLNMHFVEVSRDILVAMNDNSEENLFKQRIWIHMSPTTSWQGAFVGLGNGNGYITISQSRLKKQGFQLGDVVKIKLEKDDSEYGMELSEELQAIFTIEPTYKTLFDGLTKGMQRYILYYILQVKSSNKREERALMLMNNLLKYQNQKITFRLLLGKED